MDLNAAQRQAVEHDGLTLGPLAVLAGPGTGKTRVITHRVARLVNDGHDPETIVATTFTTKAATQLRERLGGLIGPEAADRVRVSTLHALGRSVLTRFGDLLDLPARPMRIDSAQRRRVLRTLIREHGLFEWLGANGRDRAIDQALQHFEYFWNHALTPERCAREAQAWQDRLDGRDDDDSDVQRHELRTFRDVGELWGRFQSACRSRGWMSFGDDLLLAIRVLREQTVAASIARAEARHLVVDEFQDVNPAQIELLSLLAPSAGPSGSRGPDVCVVGDDDQAIYAFRGADDRAFATFAQRWPGARVIELSENYRSASSVIAAASASIARNTDRFAPGKRVVRAGAVGQDPPGAGVACVEVDHAAQGDEAVAAMVLDASRQGVAWSDIAVIARGHTALERMAGALELEGVPVRRSKSPGATDDAAVQDVMAWLELLRDPSQSWAARRLLVRPPLRVPAAEAFGWERAWRAARAEDAFGGTLLEWLRQQDHPSAERLLGWHDELSTLAATSAVDELVTRIFERTDPAHAEVLPGPERARRVSRLVAMLRGVRRLADRLDPPRDLRAFFDYYHDLDRDEQGFAEPGDEGYEEEPEPEPGEPREGVRLLTAHAAKGLEFDTVFVMHVEKTSGGIQNVRAPEPLMLPEPLRDAPESERKPRLQSEARRLFYVACTRAERRLVLLAKRAKKHNGTYFQELVHEHPELVQRVQGSDALQDAQERGVRLQSAGEPTGVAGGSAVDRARRVARREAGAALDQLAWGTPDEDALREAVDRLRAAAGLMTSASAAERGEYAGAWFDANGAPAALRDAADALRAGAADDSVGVDAVGGATIGRALQPPLRLSYSAIDAYQRCPMCYYLTRVMRLGEPETEALRLGTVVHDALHRFVDGQRMAEAEGAEWDGSLAALTELGVRSYRRALGKVAGEWDPEGEAKVLEMLGSYHEHLHDAGAHVLELERRAVWAYEAGGHRHELEARLDRVDQGENGVKLIDYKTGSARKALLEPAADDLQMGMYAMALRAMFGEASGTAEYWILRTGERGVIDLADVDEPAVRSVIDAAAEGMLAGRFGRTPGCEGPCRLLDGTRG